MYPILGKAVIEHSIENLKLGGISKIFLVVGFQKGSLMDYVGDGSFYGVDVAYLYQMRRKGIGHCILKAKDWIQTTFVTLLGDSFIEPKVEIKEMIDFHQKKKPISTVLVFEVEDPTGYGIVKFRELENGFGMIEKMVEKPTKEEARGFESNGKYYALCGAYVFEPGIFEYISRTPPGIKKEIQITDAISMAMKDGKKVFGMVLKGEYLDIGKWNTVLKVEDKLFRNSEIGKHIKERNDMMEKVRKHEESDGR